MTILGKRKGRATGFGKRLRELRLAANLTQAQLGEKIGMPYQNVARLERGEREPTWATVIDLADALGVDVNEFREEDE